MRRYLLDRYARITFEKNLVIGQPQAELAAPGHPLLESLVDVVLERFQPLLSQGSMLVDEADEGQVPRLLVYLEHAVREAAIQLPKRREIGSPGLTAGLGRERGARLV